MRVVPLGDLPSDILPDLAALELRVFRASTHYDDTPWRIENFARSLPGKNELSLVAMAPAVVGFVVASRRAAGVHVHRLAVDPDHRRSGIATNLLTQLIGGSAGRVTVVCHPRNATALDLYQRSGFSAAGTTEGGKVLLATREPQPEAAEVPAC